VTIWRGGCLCGRIRFEASGEPDRVVSCHCGMCRRHSGAAFLTFARFLRENLRLLAARPASYRSSPRAVRSFCPRCGSHLSFAYDVDLLHIWLTAGSLDRADRLRPPGHCWLEDRLPWVALPPGDASESAASEPAPEPSEGG
jgi:hypothetical protein